MDAHTLVLDKSYQPVERVSWQDAFRKVFNEAAEVVEYYADKIVRSASQEWQVPSVIRLLTYNASNKKKIKFSRANIYARDKGTCFADGTRILMANGSLKNIKDVQVGDRVIDAYGNAQDVVACGNTKVKKVISLIRRNSFESTITTPEHPFLDEKGEWVEIKNKPNYVCRPKTISYEQNTHKEFLDLTQNVFRDEWCKVRNGRVFFSKRPHEIGCPLVWKQTAEFARFLGLYVAEGSSSIKLKNISKISFSFHIKEKDTLAYFVSNFLSTKGFKPTILEFPERKTCIVRANSKGLALMLGTICGSKNFQKKVPYDFISLYPKSFIQGLFEGDRHIRQSDKKAVLSLVSKEVIFQVQAMLWGLGINTSIQEIKRENRLNTWSVIVCEENFKKFMELIYNEKIKEDARESFSNDTHFLFKVKEIEEIEKEEIVYNFEVENTNSYIANGMAVHNCQYCGDKVPLSKYTMDHVLPRAQGGVTKWENIVVSCLPCNQDKGNRTPERANMRLRSKPVRPTNLRQQFSWLDKNVPESWRAYLYWHTELENSND